MLASVQMALVFSFCSHCTCHPLSSPSDIPEVPVWPPPPYHAGALSLSLFSLVYQTFLNLTLHSHHTGQRDITKAQSEVDSGGSLLSARSNWSSIFTQLQTPHFGGGLP